MLEAAIAHPHRDATLIVGSATHLDPDPIVGEIGLDDNGNVVAPFSIGHPVSTRRLFDFDRFCDIGCNREANNEEEVARETTIGR